MESCMQIQMHRPRPALMRLAHPCSSTLVPRSFQPCSFYCIHLAHRSSIPCSSQPITRSQWRRHSQPCFHSLLLVSFSRNCVSHGSAMAMSASHCCLWRLQSNSRERLSFPRSGGKKQRLCLVMMDVGRPFWRTVDGKDRAFWDVHHKHPGSRTSEVRAELTAGIGAAYRQSGDPVVISNQTSFEVTSGKASPLGASRMGSGVNFALFSQHATAVTLCLFLDPEKPGTPSQEIVLDPATQRSGNVWHICIENLPLSGVLYGYRVDGPQGWEKGHRFDSKNILLDPYAKLVDSRRLFGDGNNKFSHFLGTYDFSSSPFDWEGEELPGIAEKDLVIYEMNVRAFTVDESCGLDSTIRGSYLGLIDKIPHLVELGVNAVEFLPVFEFDELELQRRPNPRDHMVNTWGYSTINFFAPMSRYASKGSGPVAAAKEFKQMVKALHAAGIEVILDVVYNHTNEADDKFPFTTSFRGIDNLVYYMVDPSKYVQLTNFSGCGNTLNCNHPVVMELVLDSLRHWVTEYHVDGFRFDLASILCRGTDGAPLASPPVIRAMVKDSVLSRCKLIAEPWDCGGLYQVGSFPNWDRWAEWNGMYRDDVRRFIKGDQGMKSAFATRLSGSADLYHKNNRKPYHSINFVVAHDGFSLYDLVTYNKKHNDANGEGGNDGSNDNFSWNCGVEGETSDPSVQAIRIRQMKNFHLALFLSQGVPMILMGDEYGHTRYGNNNSYGHDTALNHFQWAQLEERMDGHFLFLSKTIRFRHKNPLLGRDSFLSKADITWHEHKWDNPESRFLAFTLHEGDKGGGGDLYVAFNAHSFFVKTCLPAPPSGKRWYRVVDTNLPSPTDFVEEGVSGLQSDYNVAPFSSILLQAKS